MARAYTRTRPMKLPWYPGDVKVRRGRSLNVSFVETNYVLHGRTRQAFAGDGSVLVPELLTPCLDLMKYLALQNDETVLKY